MHNISQLEKQQVGLKLPKHLIEELDNLTKQFKINRTDIITEAISSYISLQKENLFYENFNNSCKELTQTLKSKKKGDLKSLDELIDEL
jgi:CopG family transcriptional regulator/antitoxin EndoAI